MSLIGHLQNVAIVGATGRLGSYFVEELVKTGKHTITALTRGGSKSKIPEGVKVIEVDYSDEAALVAALQGQEFLAIVLGSSALPETHSQIVKAAAKAGVSYIMPTAYGADITNEDLVKDDIYHKGALAKVKEIESLGINHIVMTCGFWYEWSLALGENFFGIDIKTKKATFFDDGTTKINASTMQQCGRALAALLSLPESGVTPSLSDWKNKPFRFASFRVNQRDILDSIHRVQGTTDKDWEIKHEPTGKRVADGLTALQKGDFTGFAKAMYSRAFYPSADADYESKHGISNDILKLPKEDLDEITKKVIEEVNSGILSM
ncbi:NAD(P)-binding protein [Xylariaceae sp. FL1651]|nr:NAD(P)-binding protein [Xylariaceae sp. FL1651]